MNTVDEGVGAVRLRGDAASADIRHSSREGSSRPSASVGGWRREWDSNPARFLAKANNRNGLSGLGPDPLKTLKPLETIESPGAGTKQEHGLRVKTRSGDTALGTLITRANPVR